MEVESKFRNNGGEHVNDVLEHIAETILRLLRTETLAKIQQPRIQPTNEIIVAFSKRAI